MIIWEEILKEEGLKAEGIEAWIYDWTADAFTSLPSPLFYAPRRQCGAATKSSGEVLIVIREATSLLRFFRFYSSDFLTLSSITVECVRCTLRKLRSTYILSYAKKWAYALQTVVRTYTVQRNVQRYNVR